jgi:hypothetical protein
MRTVFLDECERLIPTEAGGDERFKTLSNTLAPIRINLFRCAPVFVARRTKAWSVGSLENASHASEIRQITAEKLDGELTIAARGHVLIEIAYRTRSHLFVPPSPLHQIGTAEEAIVSNVIFDAFNSVLQVHAIILR